MHRRPRPSTAHSTDRRAAASAGSDAREADAAAAGRAVPSGAPWGAGRGRALLRSLLIGRARREAPRPRHLPRQSARPPARSWRRRQRTCATGSPTARTARCSHSQMRWATVRAPGAARVPRGARHPTRPLTHAPRRSAHALAVPGAAGHPQRAHAVCGAAAHHGGLHRPLPIPVGHVVVPGLLHRRVRQGAGG